MWPLQGWQSGLMRRTDNSVKEQSFRGFKSRTFRQAPSHKRGGLLVSRLCPQLCLDNLQSLCIFPCSCCAAVPVMVLPFAHVAV